MTRLLPMGGAGTTNYYNALGQLTNQIDFKGQKRQTRYDRYGRVATNYFFAAGSAYPSNTVHYYYNQLGQLTNVTEKFGTDASSGYIASSDVGSGVRGLGDGFGEKLLASLNNNVPQGAQGGMLGLMLCAFALICIPREKRRRFALCLAEAWRGSFNAKAQRRKGARRWRVSPAAEVCHERTQGTQRGIVPSLRSLCSFAANVFGFGSPVTPRRFRLPSYGWRFATIITLAAMIGSDPAFNGLWNARAACSIPNNYSTPTIRITTFAYDVEGRLAQVNCKRHAEDHLTGE